MEHDAIFTPEAERILAAETTLLVEEFRQQVIDEALRTRGTPVEVTASDVRRARLRYVKRDVPLMPMTEMLLRLYMTLGALFVVGGILYPILKPLFEKGDPIARTSLLTIAAGVILIAVAQFGRYYLRMRHQMISRRLLERYDRERDDERITRLKGSGA